MKKLKAFKIVKEIENYLDKLDKLRPLEEEALKKDARTLYAVSFVVEQLANECINLGNHLISFFDLGMPMTSKEIFDILKEKGFISEEIRGKMDDLISVRNIIAHRYTVLSLGRLIELVEEISFVEDLLGQISKELKKRGKTRNNQL